jgi:predicted dehydrogenase
MISRRMFLQLTAGGSLGYWYTGPAFSVQKAYGANDKIRVVGIGVGGKGSSDIDQAGKLMDVAAICDIDDERLGKKSEQFPHAKKFFDYRELFDKMAKEFDAATISTPDHHHAPASILAMRHGKHVYTQKPLTHTVFEARLMRETAAKMKVCSQMGNQGSALNGLRRAVELIHAGTIGQVTAAHVWTDRPREFWKQSPAIIARPKMATDAPKHVHWEQFIGPAPMRPYALSEVQSGRPVYHPHDWRGWWDFGTGAMGDMACHTANMAFRALKLGPPTTISAISGEINSETYPAWAHMTFDFPAREQLDPCTLHWYEGAKDGKKMLPPDALLATVLKDGEKVANSGSILIGTKGTLYSPNDYAAQFRLLPEKEFAGLQLSRPEKQPMGVDKDNDQQMKQEWFDAIRAGKPELASSSFSFAGQITETMLLGNIAVRVGGNKLEWDAEKMVFKNSAVATDYVTKEYRKGWDMLKPS